MFTPIKKDDDKIWGRCATRNMSATATMQIVLKRDEWTCFTVKS